MVDALKLERRPVDPHRRSDPPEMQPKLPLSRSARDSGRSRPGLSGRFRWPSSDPPRTLGRGLMKAGRTHPPRVPSRRTYSTRTRRANLPVRTIEQVVQRLLAACVVRGVLYATAMPLVAMKSIVVLNPSVPKDRISRVRHDMHGSFGEPVTAFPRRAAISPNSPTARAMLGKPDITMTRMFQALNIVRIVGFVSPRADRRVPLLARPAAGGLHCRLDRRVREDVSPAPGASFLVPDSLFWTCCDE